MPKKTDKTVCPICRKHFSAKGARNEHVAMVHENSGQFKCKSCDKRFLYEPRLRIHEISHMKNRGTSILQILPKPNSEYDDKPFKCDQCSYCTNRPYNLKKHLVVHLRASRRHGITQGDVASGSSQAAMEVEQPVSNNDSSSATYSLRARRKTINYNDDHVARTGGELSRPIKKSKLHEESGREDKLMLCDGLPYEEPNDAKDYTDKPDERKPAAKEYEMVSLSSDEDEENELPSMSSTITSANLTLVYDVEYQAPDEAD